MDLVDLLIRWGVLLVFGVALIEQAGFPLPAAPLLVSAGALAEAGALRAEFVLVAALAGCLIADQAWFILAEGMAAGYWRGYVPSRFRRTLASATPMT
jgi:membrane protein DedA with SNARE-associated domain